MKSIWIQQLLFNSFFSQFQRKNSCEYDISCGLLSRKISFSINEICINSVPSMTLKMNEMKRCFNVFGWKKMWTKQNICLQLAINKFTNCMDLFCVCAFIVMFANEHKIDYENISWFMQGNYVKSNVEFQCGISLRIETRWVIESQAWANYRWRFKRTNFMSTFNICVWNFQILSTFACCALNKTNKYLLPWFCFHTFVRLLSLHFPWVFFAYDSPNSIFHFHTGGL